MVSSSMLIVDPALLVKVVMEVVVDNGWMVFPATPAPVCKHMLTLPCPVCWCIIPGEESEHLRGSGRTELISPNTKKFPIWNGSCWMTLFKQRHQLHQRPLNLEDPQPILFAPKPIQGVPAHGPVHQICPEESWRRFLFGCCHSSNTRVSEGFVGLVNPLITSAASTF